MNNQSITPLVLNLRTEQREKKRLAAILHDLPLRCCSMQTEDGSLKARNSDSIEKIVIDVIDTLNP